MVEMSFTSDWNQRDLLHVTDTPNGLESKQIRGTREKTSGGGRSGRRDERRRRLGFCVTGGSAQAGDHGESDESRSHQACDDFRDVYDRV